HAFERRRPSSDGTGSQDRGSCQEVVQAESGEEEGPEEGRPEKEGEGEGEGGKEAGPQGRAEKVGEEGSEAKEVRTDFGGRFSPATEYPSVSPQAFSGTACCETRTRAAGCSPSSVSSSSTIAPNSDPADSVIATTGSE